MCSSRSKSLLPRDAADGSFALEAFIQPETRLSVKAIALSTWAWAVSRSMSSSTPSILAAQSYRNRFKSCPCFQSYESIREVGTRQGGRETVVQVHTGDVQGRTSAHKLGDVRLRTRDTVAFPPASLEPASTLPEPEPFSVFCPHGLSPTPQNTASVISAAMSLPASAMKRKADEMEDEDDEEPTLGRQVLPVANLSDTFNGVPTDGMQYLFTVR